MRNAFDIAAGVPWLITEDGLRQILAIAARENLDVEAVARAWEAREASPDAVALRGAERLPGTKRTLVRDGVAVVPVVGPIMRYADLFSSLSGATSTETIGRDFQTALDSPDVHSVLMSFDSPGGQARGIGELASAIRQGNQKKPVTAYVGDMAASAAYWLASAANEIVLSPTAFVGSIGAAMPHTDTSQRDARDGVRNMRIVSSQSPNKQLDPATPEGTAAIRAMLDALAEQFISAVAENRNATPERVAEDFGQGALIPKATDAIRLGMADRLGTFEATLSTLAARKPNRTFVPATGRVAQSQENDMTVKDTAAMTATEIAAANPTAADALRAEGRTALAINAGFVAQHFPALKAALAEAGTPIAAPLTLDAVRSDHPAIASAFKAEGAEAATVSERERISKISKRTLPGHHKLRDDAIAAGTSYSDFLDAQTAAEQEKGPRKLEALRQDEKEHPKVEAIAPSTEQLAVDKSAPLEERAKADWEGKPALREEFSSLAAYTAFLRADESGRVKRLGR